MAQFKAMDKRTEVNGQTVLSVANGLGAMRANGLKILAENNIENPEPDQWYSQQDWLNAFKAIAEKIGPRTLNVIGKSIPENAQFPPEIDNIEKALSAIDVAYHMNHRIEGRVLFDPSTGSMSEGIGHYHYRKTGEREAELKCDNPYPCDFDRGIIESMASRFKPSDTIFIKVKHAEGECRKNGDEACVYTVSW